MKPDNSREAALVLQEAQALLSEEEAKPKSFDQLRATLERLGKALETPPSLENGGRMPFAPPPRTPWESLADFMGAAARTVVALASILLTLTLAFGKADAPQTECGRCMVCGKYVSLQCDLLSKREVGNE